jgi:hypothetical protein
VNRLVVRLVISHVLVAVLGAVATFLVVRQLAPALFDESMHRMPIGAGMARARPAPCASSSPTRSTRPCSWVPWSDRPRLPPSALSRHTA